MNDDEEDIGTLTTAFAIRCLMTIDDAEEIIDDAILWAQDWICALPAKEREDVERKLQEWREEHCI